MILMRVRQSGPRHLDLAQTCAAGMTTLHSALTVPFGNVTLPPKQQGAARPRRWGDFRMNRRMFAPVCLLIGLVFPVVSARAEPFKCPHVGGDFVFGQEANINTLDQMTSATISTRNIAMNIYESLMTRD